MRRARRRSRRSLALGQIVIVVLSLLVWLPGPATGGAKVFAWLLILCAVVER